MTSTDISEKGLESLIMHYMTGTDDLAVVPDRVAERPPAFVGTGYFAGSAKDYDREIELLREYCTRLVADVVTGKLDVREAAAQLPDEVPPEEESSASELADEAESADEEASIEAG